MLNNIENICILICAFCSWTCSFLSNVPLLSPELNSCFILLAIALPFFGMPLLSLGQYFCYIFPIRAFISLPSDLSALQIPVVPAQCFIQADI